MSPSSPETQIHGFDVVIALLSFLMGIITDLYGITENGEGGKNKLVVTSFSPQSMQFLG